MRDDVYAYELPVARGSGVPTQMGAILGYGVIPFRLATEAPASRLPKERHPLTFNRADAEAFLAALDPAATSWTFLTFDDNKKREDKNLTRVLPGTLGSRWDLLANLNRRGAGIFVVVNATDGEGIAAANVKRIRSLFVDLDGAPLPAADAFHVRPHVVIESSPGRWHCYWLVTNCDPKQFEALQRRLIRHYGGDAKITNTNRVMRLPGFVHQKVDKHGNACEPSVSQLAEAHDHAPCTVEAFAEGLPDLPEEEKKTDGGGDGAAGPDQGNGAGDPNWFEQYGNSQARSSARDWTPAEDLKVRAAVFSIPVDEAILKEKFGDSHAIFVNIGRAIERLGWGERGFAIWRDWCWQSPKFDESGLRGQWASFGRTRDSGENRKITVGTIFHYAKQFEQEKEEPKAAATTPIDLWGHLNPPELPRGLLPPVIEQFAFEQGEVMGVDPGGLAVAALTACAAAIPDSIELQVKRHDRGWTESARLWAALVGMPSTKKTPTLREAIRPLARIDAAYAREYAAAMENYDDLPKDQRKQATKPVRRQLKLEDTSIEAAQEVLRDNPAGVLCLADELSGWFGSMDKYNSGRGAAKDRGFWLQAWNGGSYAVNRINRGSYLIENLSVSVLGGIQPDLIRKMADESHDDGLIQRLLPVVMRAATEGQDEARHEIVDAYEKLIDSLHRLKPTFTAGWDNVGGRETKLGFDDDAQAIRRRLEKKHLELMGLEVINKKLAAHIGKYDAFWARLCVVFHCVDHLSGPAQRSMAFMPQNNAVGAVTSLPCTITAATAERAAKFLHQFLLRHAAAFYAGILDLSDDHDRLAAVAGHILAHKLDRVTNRDVQRGDRTMRNLTRWDTERVFEQLEALGWVFRRPAPRPADPPHWQVNPEVHRLFADRAGQEATRRAAVRQLLTELGGK
jgi:hypothetical protein